MKGKIIKYIEEKGYGFILDERGLKRFFHISDTLSPLDIKVYQMVEFEPDENEKGLVSKKIQIMDIIDIKDNTKNNTKFITINNTNIKCSNIKQFGISSDKDIFYKKIHRGFFGFTEDRVEMLKYEDLPDYTVGAFDDLRYIKGSKYTMGYTEVEQTYDYLYITTYQGENHKWRGNKEELEEKIKYIKESLG